MTEELRLASIDLLLAQLHAQAAHVAQLENGPTPPAGWLEEAEEHLRRALVLLEEAYA